MGHDAEAQRVTAGAQGFHRGRPIELLWLISGNLVGQTWRVRPLFVEGPDRDEWIPAGTTLRPIHGAAK